ncbi:uncharacterized protein LOC128875485 [Hylaeus volcanicus]|uniref:uncharacterized protein LOC128875485 n=1 Tax=Hylaeus volcanicus TaxID=313075 RepID=UPI0023B7D2DC|nr:uncharacterized protein LOC128875485 [Hylaeus volcanicus]
MGHYASGDTRKTIHSSEDDEGYENQSYSTISIELQARSGITDKPRLSFGKCEGISPLPIPPTSDDTDRPFWGEDELSSSESRQQLNPKQKRRRSFSYRNRIALRSLLFQSSSSSIDSISEQISSRVLKQERYSRYAGRFGVEQLQPGCSVTKKKYAYKKVPLFSCNDQNVYSRCRNSMHKYAQKRNSVLTNKKVRRKSCSTSSSGNDSRNH